MHTASEAGRGAGAFGIQGAVGAQDEVVWLEHVVQAPKIALKLKAERVRVVRKRSSVGCDRFCSLPLGHLSACNGKLHPNEASIRGTSPEDYFRAGGRW